MCFNHCFTDIIYSLNYVERMYVKAIAILIVFFFFNTIYIKKSRSYIYKYLYWTYVNIWYSLSTTIVLLVFFLLLISLIKKNNNFCCYWRFLIQKKTLKLIWLMSLKWIITFLFFFVVVVTYTYLELSWDFNSTYVLIEIIFKW